MFASTVLPAVIPQSLAHLSEAISVIHTVASEIQIDIVDGVFVTDVSWPYREGTVEDNVPRLKDAIPHGLSFELDLMIADPLATLPLWVATGSTSVVLHIEGFGTSADIVRAIEMVHTDGGKVVLSALNDTPLERLATLAPLADGIQCMGIAEIGRQGNPFDELVLARIAELREKYPDLSIGVDGGVNADTIARLKEVGADRFVAGSAIFGAADPQAAYRRLADLVSF